MKLTVLFTVLFSTLVASADADCNAAYPSGPNATMTPGDVCHQADSYRYDERIAYCSRDVSSQTKQSIIRQYDAQLGYRIQTMPRGKFKIDHFIPLCMGGSNERINLWPQHESVYKITDPLEQKLCEKMSQGKILQAEAIDLIRQAKNHLDQAPAILQRVTAL
jgi:hypothetical protein